jgi:hypothetical protein
VKKQIEKTIGGRNSVAHGRKRKILASFPTYIQNGINLARSLYDPVAADKMQKILDAVNSHLTFEEVTTMINASISTDNGDELSDKFTLLSCGSVPSPVPAGEFASVSVPSTGSGNSPTVENHAIYNFPRQISQRSTKRSPRISRKPSILLSSVDETKAMAICSELGDIISYYVAPATYNFVVGKGMFDHNYVYDLYEHLKFLKGKHPDDLKVLLVPIKDVDIEKILETAFEGRNSVEHFNLPDVLAKWEEYLVSWYYLCHAMGFGVVGTAMEQVYRKIRAIVQ